MPGHDHIQQFVHCDTLHHTAYYSGINDLFDDDNNGPGAVLAWKNEQWDTVAYTHGYIEEFIVFHDTMIMKGPFYVNDDTISGIAYHNGTQWLDFPVQPADFSVQRFRVIEDTLYAAIASSDIDQLWPFIRLVNGQWEQFGTLEGIGGSLGLDIAKYNGAFYGVMAGTSDGNNFYRLDGQNWTGLGPELNGAALSPGLLTVFNGRLYIGGGAGIIADVPFNGMCSYDGQGLLPLGMGLQSYPGNTFNSCGAVDMVAHGDYLFVSTGCDYVGGMYCPGIGAWDGTRWCTVEGVFLENSAGAWSMDFMGDTLYVGCGATISGEEVGHAARFIGPDFADSCGTITFVPLDAPVQERIALNPNPVSEVLSISLHDMRAHDLPFHIIDSRGVVRWTGQARSQDLEVHDWAKGVYQLIATGRDGITQRVPFVVQ